MKTLYLYGNLSEKHGESYDLEVDSPAEAIRALATQLPGFTRDLEQGSWRVVRGPLDGGYDLDEEGLNLALGKENQVHLVPAIEGAGSDGVGKVLGGIALIGAAMFIPGGAAIAGIGIQSTVASIGVSMALGGVSMMLAPSPSSNYGEREEPAQRPSFLFDGPVNTSTQGLPLPLIYGRVKTGSIVISAGLTAEEI